MDKVRPPMPHTVTATRSASVHVTAIDPKCIVVHLWTHSLKSGVWRGLNVVKVGLIF